MYGQRGFGFDDYYNARDDDSDGEEESDKYADIKDKDDLSVEEQIYEMAKLDILSKADSVDELSEVVQRVAEERNLSYREGELYKECREQLNE